MVYNAERMKLDLNSTSSDGDRTLHTRTLTLLWCYRIYPRPPANYPQLRLYWEEAWRNWTESAACHQLTDLLNEERFMPKVKNIVCFGLGSLQGRDPEEIAICDGLPCFRGMTQHAAALTMASVLGKRFNTDPLPILAQDPCYTDAEKQLLTEVGIEIVGGLGCLGFTYVDDHSLVYTCGADILVTEIVADIARPALMLCHEVIPAQAIEEKMAWTVEVYGDEEVICA